MYVGSRNLAGSSNRTLAPPTRPPQRGPPTSRPLDVMEVGSNPLPMA